MNINYVYMVSGQPETLESIRARLNGFATEDLDIVLAQVQETVSTLPDLSECVSATVNVTFCVVESQKYPGTQMVTGWEAWAVFYFGGDLPEYIPDFAEQLAGHDKLSRIMCCPVPEPGTGWQASVVLR